MRTVVLALVVACAVSAYGSTAHANEPVVLRFAPEPGTSVRKTWTSSGRRELERLEVRTADVTSEPQSLAVLLTGSKRLVVEDRYERVERGRPLEFTRLYEELDAKRKLETTAAEDKDTLFAADTCELEGRAVRFRWNETRYERAYTEPPAPDRSPARVSAGAGLATDGDQLAGLAADMDLLALLPPERSASVAPGDEWPVAFEAFRAVVRPGGELACTTEPPEGAGERELADRVWSSLDGTIVARYLGPGPAGTARIAFEGTYTGTGEKRTAASGVTRRRMETRMRVEGELVWSTTHRRAASLAMTSAGTVTTTDDILVKEGGSERAFERVLSFREESELQALFESH